MGWSEMIAKGMKRLGIYLILALIACSAQAMDLASEHAVIGTKMLSQYFELLAADNFEIAHDMWLPEVQERSSRFGIEYEGCPLRIDCNSPVVQNLDRVRYDLLPPVKRYKGLERRWVELEFDRVAAGLPIHYNYYAYATGDWSWLGYRQDMYIHTWDSVESKYFRVHMHPSVTKYMNPVALADADRFVEAMCDTLDMPSDLRKEIAEKKIEYFFCAGDSVVEKLTGHLTKGMLDLPTNDVISAVFPHYHEVTHLLVNMKLHRLPLYTLPMLREGIAVRYGGRWGKHPASLAQLAKFLYREELVPFDSVLTYTGFDEQAGADIVYPVAGLFTAYLLDRLGQDKYFELYRSLSGKYDDLAALTTDKVEGVIATALGKGSWADVITDFNSFIDDDSALMTAVPGKLDKGKSIAKGDGYQVREDGKWLGFEFTPTMTDDGKVSGNLLFAKADDLQENPSSLFEEQYQAKEPFEGYRYGVRFDQNEIGLYDYATNCLIAKYIWGVTPSDDYLDKDKGTVTVKFSKWLFDGGLPSDKTGCHLLPN